ncbi:MAG: hypothetical protein OXU20_07510 [Myxococcales bacterium]|nr:hypothetical protein [Myxococcales bacterium]MDD9966511.1 hypothetical protein [Myxococcales bacterium]
MDAENAAQQLDRYRFGSRWRAIGASHDRAFDELATRYAEGHRAYHNSEHIAECNAWLDRVVDLADHPDELEVAVYFHDAVYEPSAQDNEALSAELFCELAQDASIHVEVTARIAGLIKSTATHDCTDGDGALLSDIDLAILGTPPARYARYEDAIRREYSAVADESYRMGRARVLETFLERIAIYRTPRMAALLEAQARDNLSRALAALRQ